MSKDVKGINCSWEHLPAKIKQLKKERETYYTKIQNFKSYEEYINLITIINQLNIHISVCEMYHKDRSIVLTRASQEYNA
jgi:hypothetical protein